MIRASAALCAFAVALACAGRPAAAQQPAAVAAGENAPAAEPEPTFEPVTMKPRAYATLRFGRMGRSALETSEADLEGTPNHVFGIGLRGEFPLLPNLSLAGDMLISGVTGADLTEGNERADIKYTPIDLGLVLAPRLPLARGAVEVRLPLMLGLGVLALIDGEFPVKGQGPLERYAFAEHVAIGGYFGAGLGATCWLNAHWSAFLELDVLHRAAGATVRPGLSVFDTGQPQPKSRISIAETYGALLIGVGYSQEGP